MKSAVRLRMTRFLLGIVSSAVLSLALTACGGAGGESPARDRPATAQAAPDMAAPLPGSEAADDPSALGFKRRLSLSTQPANLSAELLLRWVEFRIPSLFPAASAIVYQAVTVEGQTYYIREYRGPWGSRFLGVTNTGQVLGLGDWTGNLLQSYGVVADWASLVLAESCSFDAASCAAPGIAQPMVAVTGLGSAFGITRNGALVAWGVPGVVLGSAGLIEGTAVRPVALPVPALGVSGVMADTEIAGIAGGRVVVVGNDGALYGWGRAPAGQLGDRPPETMLTTPTRIEGVDNVSAALATSTHTLLIRRDGSLWTWPGTAFVPTGPGIPFRYAAGQGTQPGSVARFVGSSGGSPLGSALALVLTADGSAARVTIRTTAGIGTISTLPSVMPISGWTQLTDFDCATSHCIGLRPDGSVIAGGGNARGQLGLGNTQDVALGTPVVVPGLARIVDVAVSGTTSFAVDADGRVWAWGDRVDAGGLPGTEVFVTRPRVVPGLNSIVRIDTWPGMITALDRSGRVYSWILGLDALTAGDSRSRIDVPLQARGLAL